MQLASRQRDETQRLFAQAETELNDLQDAMGGDVGLDDYYARILRSCPETTMAEIEVKIDDLQNELNSTLPSLFFDITPSSLIIIIICRHYRESRDSSTL
jgi:hypothetical protein